MLRAIAAAKKKNDRIDATKICRGAPWPDRDSRAAPLAALSQ
jgi:hypothetical protein